MTEPQRLGRILDFLAITDQFKSIERAVTLLDGSRPESDAEHSWHMGLFALLLARETALELDLGRVQELIIVHDLVEIYAGDAYAHDPAERRDKHARELAAAERLFPVLPPDLTELLRGRWDEYEEATSPEARFARAIDRLQAFAQNVLSGGQLWRHRGVTEAMSRAYNRDAMELDPALARAFEMLYERASRGRIWEEDPFTPRADGR